MAQVLVKRYGMVEEKQAEIEETIEADDFDVQDGALILGRSVPLKPGHKQQDVEAVKIYAPGSWISVGVVS